jgi:Pyruvate/2-oxoacid:ferredoxin oxidoreductase gamma subunit
MFQVRFHGRGGQGVVTAAELLAAAAFSEGRHAQAFPGFGSERMGAPVMSFCRIDDKPIQTHEPVSEPDALIIQDPTLLHQADLFAGLGHDGYMLINSAHGFDELGLDEFVKPFRRDRLLGGAGLGAGPDPPRPPATRRRAARRVRRADLGGQPGLGASRRQREVQWRGRGRQ